MSQLFLPIIPKLSILSNQNLLLAHIKSPPSNSNLCLRTLRHIRDKLWQTSLKTCRTHTEPALWPNRIANVLHVGASNTWILSNIAISRISNFHLVIIISTIRSNNWKYHSNYSLNEVIRNLIY